MALANFFDRAATAASQVLANFQLGAFQSKLAEQAVGISFDDAAARSKEANASLDLVVRLLARLYPTLHFQASGPVARELATRLRKTAKAINPVISFARSQKQVTFCIGLGDAPGAPDCPIVYIGSEGWRAKLSARSPVGSADSRNPFGAGAAACFGAANAFRSIFADQLSKGDRDSAIDLSLLSLKQNDAGGDAWFDAVDLGNSHLVGLGAIGNGAIWALARAPNLTGTLDLIDHDSIDLSNLQRYALAHQRHIGTRKVELAAAAFPKGKLAVKPHSVKWSEYLNQRRDWCLQRVVVGVDSAADRIAIQGSLPRWIANAWTQDLDLGISRHRFGDGGPCLACLYMPTGKTKDEDEIVAEALRMPAAKMEIRNLLQTGQPVDAVFVDRVAQAFGVPQQELSGFVGQPIRAFYQRAVCGGLLMKLTDGQQAATATVPMAFQSALAGIMLAAELIKDAAGCAPAPTPITRVNLLRPLAPFLHDPRAMNASGRCMCADADFLAVYNRKYGVARDRTGSGAIADGVRGCTPRT